MLKNTRAVLYDTFKAIKNIRIAFTLITSIFFVLFPIYKIFANQGLLIVNIVVLALAIASLSFVLYVELHHIKRKEKKQVKKTIKTIKKCSRIISNTAIVLTTIIGLIIGTTYNLLTIFLFLIAIVALAFDLLVSLIVNIIESRKELFINAFEIDMKELNPLQRFKKDEEKEELPQNLQNIVESFERDKEKKKEETKEKIKSFFKKNNKKDKRA